MAKWRRKLWQLSRASEQVERQVVNAAMAICCKAGRWAWALRLLRHGGPPDAVAYATAMAAPWRTALALLQEATEKQLADRCQARKSRKFHVFHRFSSIFNDFHVFFIDLPTNSNVYLLALLPEASASTRRWPPWAGPCAGAWRWPWWPTMASRTGWRSVPWRRPSTAPRAGAWRCMPWAPGRWATTP